MELNCILQYDHYWSSKELHQEPDGTRYNQSEFIVTLSDGLFFEAKTWDPETQSKRVWVLGKFVVGWKELVDLVGSLVDLPLWKMMELKSVGMMKFPIWWKNNPNVPNHQSVSHKIS